MRTIILLLLSAMAVPAALHAQSPVADSAVSKLALAGQIPDKSLAFINKKYTALTNEVDSQTVKVLQRMQRREAKLQQKLQGIDSVKAQQLFTGTEAKYQQLQAKLQAPLNSSVVTRIKQYIPNLDSLSTSMKFLSSNSSLPTAQLQQVQAVSSQLQQLQGRLQEANDAQAFIQQREQRLKGQLGQYSNLSGQLLGMNKEAYYYQAQLAQYKAMINDREKLEQAVLAKVETLPAFQSFMQKNSMLAQLFPMPQNGSSATTSVTGLQTRSQIQNLLATRMPSPDNAAGSTGVGTDPTQYMQQQIQQAQSQLNSLKDKLSQLGGASGGGSTSVTMPDFTPNSQHNKSFFKRLQFGYNFQTTSSTSLLPAICNMGLSVGYKLSDKATVGTGASYLLGMGNGFSHIAFTNQGVGLRSFVDIKAKGSIWVTGGYEYNYMQQFAKFSEIKNLDIWQRSALVGLTKKYKIGKKEGNLQLLYDLLAYKEIPHGQPIVFRVGYSF